MPFKGRGRSWTDGRTSPMRWCVRSWQMSPHKKWKTNREIHVLHHNQLLLITSEVGIPLHMGVCQGWDRCTSPTPVRPTPRGSDSKTALQEDNTLAINQHQARKTPLGWINGKLWLFPCMSTRASTEDGWRFQVMCSGHGYFPWQMAKRLTCIWWRDRCQPVDTSG